MTKTAHEIRDFETYKMSLRSEEMGPPSAGFPDLVLTPSDALSAGIRSQCPVRRVGKCR
jgi:hypothetical protein